MDEVRNLDDLKIHLNQIILWSSYAFYKFIIV